MVILCHYLYSQLFLDAIAAVVFAHCGNVSRTPVTTVVGLLVHLYLGRLPSPLLYCMSMLFHVLCELCNMPCCGTYWPPWTKIKLKVEVESVYTTSVCWSFDLF